MSSAYLRKYFSLFGKVEPQLPIVWHFFITSFPRQKCWFAKKTNRRGWIEWFTQFTFRSCDITKASYDHRWLGCGYKRRKICCDMSGWSIFPENTLFRERKDPVPLQICGFYWKLLQLRGFQLKKKNKRSQTKKHSHSYSPLASLLLFSLCYLCLWQTCFLKNPFQIAWRKRDGSLARKSCVTAIPPICSPVFVSPHLSLYLFITTGFSLPQLTAHSPASKSVEFSS